MMKRKSNVKADSQKSGKVLEWIFKRGDRFTVQKTFGGKQKNSGTYHTSSEAESISETIKTTQDFINYKIAIENTKELSVGMTKPGDRFIVQKAFDGKQEYLGSYDTLSEAETVYKTIKTTQDFINFRKARHIATEKIIGIYKRDDSFIVQKAFDGKQEYLGSYDTLSEAETVYKTIKTTQDFINFRKAREIATEK
jgi:hypothetical protein